jgi:hypothetical protein
MNQKQVKIIGLKINEQLGILQSCELRFDEDCKLIAVKGEVGAGKTTLQKSLQLGTLGSDTLKHDKGLFGDIDEEVQLMDGDKNVFVGCKSSATGALDYVIYLKDENGKKINNPVVDGVKLTPASYLKTMQTALTWRMDELMSESSVVQKKLLLELYKSELSKAGVVFDKKSEDFQESILGQIELAEAKRSDAEYKRKSVGGFINQLEPLGVFVDDVETHPVMVSIEDLEREKSKKSFEIENVELVKQQNLDGIKNKADQIINKIKEKNNEIKEKNRLLESDFEKKKEKHSQNIHTLNGIKTDVKTLVENDCLTLEEGNTFVDAVSSAFKNDGATCATLNHVVDFDDEGKITTKSAEWKGDQEMMVLLQELEESKIEYLTEFKKQGDTSKLEDSLKFIVDKLANAKIHNKKVDMLSSFMAWRECNHEVVRLRDEFSEMLGSIDTGVDGLQIAVDKEDGKMEIYLRYNGAFDPVYFGNPNMEQRKLSSYSGTQKPLICLLLQNYLLNKLPKAMRYLWIDNVPIDKKTKALLEKMGSDLNVTIIVNMTGDFTKEGLKNGEVLIEGGHVFFNADK